MIASSALISLSSFPLFPSLFPSLFPFLFFRRSPLFFSRGLNPTAPKNCRSRQLFRAGGRSHVVPTVAPT